MANTRISQVSFARGEFCPPLYMRTDLEQYAIGLKTLKNGFVHQEGCVSNRSGLEYVGEVKDSSKETRLIPFTFNTEQTYIIEAGEGYFRFIQDGGYIVYPDDYGNTYTVIDNNNDSNNVYDYVAAYVVAAQVTERTDLGGTSYVLYMTKKIVLSQNSTQKEVYYKDSAFLKNNNSNPYETLPASLDNGVIPFLTGLRVGTVLYNDINCTNYFGEIKSVNTTNRKITMKPIVAEETQNSSYIDLRGQVVEIETPYKAEDLQKLKFAQSGDILTITHMNYQPMELARYDHHIWELSPIIFEPAIDPPSSVSVVWSGSTSSNTREYTYLVTAVDSETLEESARSTEVTATGHREAHWETSEYFTISWAAVNGAVEYNVYRSVNGIFGYVGTSTGTSFVDDKIEPDLTETAPVLKNPFANGNNPSCCAYYQQRKVYANTINNPQTLYASQTATSNNFNCSRPLIASDAVEIALADREVNEIMHLIPFKDLIALTSNSEYKINGSDGKFEASPPPVATVQSSYGASHVQPVVSGSMVLFVEAGGNVIRELGYDYLSDSYDGDELSLFASHLFEGKEIIYIAYAKAPYRLVYVIFNDGTMATLTYNKKQKLCGWARQETQGLFRSVAVVREGKEDVAYFIIQREINNKTVQYVERTKTRIIKNAKRGFLVDCGLYAHFNTPVTSVSGLDHLKNTEVIALADGGVIQGLTVSAQGTLSLPSKTTDLVVGLPYEFELETLGVEGENTHGLKKMINTVTVNILNSREDFFIVGNEGDELQLARSIDSINDTGLLFSGKKDSTPLNTPTDRATIHIKQKYPLPLTVSAVSAIVNIEDISDGR